MQKDEIWQMPDWWCRNERPTDDSVYFENLCRIIFQAGLNWQVIDGKWETTKKAFANFDIKEIACFTDSDVQRLLKDPGIVRNKGKIKAIIKMHKTSKQSKNVSAHSKIILTASTNQITMHLQSRI